MGDRAMMGRLEAQENLFYRFRIEDHVPKDHLLRKINWLLDFDAICADLAELYSHTGRPSVDPELMLRMPAITAAWKSSCSANATSSGSGFSPISAVFGTA